MPARKKPKMKTPTLGQPKNPQVMHTVWTAKGIGTAKTSMGSDLRFKKDSPSINKARKAKHNRSVIGSSLGSNAWGETFNAATFTKGNGKSLVNKKAKKRGKK